MSIMECVFVYDEMLRLERMQRGVYSSKDSQRLRTHDTKRWIYSAEVIACRLVQFHKELGNAAKNCVYVEYTTPEVARFHVIHTSCVVSFGFEVSRKGDVVTPIHRA